MCARRPTSAMPKPMCLRTSLQPFRLMVAFWCWLVVFPWCVGVGDAMCGMWYRVVGCEVRWSNALGCELTWSEVMWLVARCHVIYVMRCDMALSHLVSFDVIWFFVSCHVMWCNAMSCDVMSPAVKWCDAMRWDATCLWCDVVACEVMFCDLKWLCDLVNSKMSCKLPRANVPVLRLRTSKYYRTPKYYKVLLFCTTKYYCILQSTTPYYRVLLRTTKYYKVVLRTTKYYKVVLRTSKYYKALFVLLCTAPYYLSKTPYHKVLQSTPYYKILQSATPY